MLASIFNAILRPTHNSYFATSTERELCFACPTRYFVVSIFDPHFVLFFNSFLHLVFSHISTHGIQKRDFWTPSRPQLGLKQHPKYICPHKNIVLSLTAALFAGTGTPPGFRFHFPSIPDWLRAPSWLNFNDFRLFLRSISISF